MTKDHINYILVRKKWSKIIRNCESYNTLIYLGSDHIIVVANVTLSLRASKQIAKRKPKLSKVSTPKTMFGAIKGTNINYKRGMQLKYGISFALRD